MTPTKTSCRGPAVTVLAGDKFDTLPTDRGTIEVVINGEIAAEWRKIETPEQAARDMLERMGIENAQNFTAGDVVELANLIAEKWANSPAWEPLTPERLARLNQDRSAKPVKYWFSTKGQRQGGEPPYLGTYSFYNEMFYVDEGELVIEASTVTHIMVVSIPEMPKG